MPVENLPADLIAFLHTEEPPTLDAGVYGSLTLLRGDELRVETLNVTPANTPYADEDPRRDDYGHYPVPAINLVCGSPRPSLDFPAWLFLWLPGESRYGSYDLDHGGVVMFSPTVDWTDIAAGAEAFAVASEGGGDGPIPIEPLRPWIRYEFVAEDYPLEDDV